MRVMLVEDQQIILSGIQKMIEDELDCEIQAMLSGESALKALEQSPAPDIVISDVVMPEMDGLCFIEQAKKLLPFSHFYIVSGYDRFSFAQKALQLGVADYFLKPIERRRFLDALAAAFESHRARWTVLRSACMEDFLLLQSAAQTMQPRIEQLRTANGLSAGVYCVRGEAPAFHMLLPGCYLIGADVGIALYLLLLPRETFDDAHRQITSRPGVSFGTDEAGDAAQAFVRCARQDDNRFFPQCGHKVLHYGLELTRLEEALALQEGRKKAVDVAISVFLRALENPDSSGRSIRAAVEALLSRLPHQADRFDVARCWQLASTYEEFLSAVRHRAASWDGAPSEDTLSLRIKRYVDAHCAQPLNVKQVASAMALSPNYASSLFKREMGQSLSAYIRQRQLETARHLLLSTDMRVYEIAEQLGYADEKHFSAMFRMYYHLSPNAIRRETRETQETEHGE